MGRRSARFLNSGELRHFQQPTPQVRWSGLFFAKPPGEIGLRHCAPPPQRRRNRQQLSAKFRRAHRKNRELA
jgi:hypothetical protein